MSKFENYDKYYTNFQRPPFAPVYRPTPEEFNDPIAYVAKIRAEAEKYGVVKIIPPQDFKPTFAIDRSTFHFVPRVQRINEVEAVFRERAVLVERLTHFWKLQNANFSVPTIENKPLDIYKLIEIVKVEGGFDIVSNKKSWNCVARSLGMKSDKSGFKVKEAYSRWIAPYLANYKVKIEKEEYDSDVDEDVPEDKYKDVKDIKPVKGQESASRGLGEGRSSMQGGSRMGVHEKNHNRKKATKKSRDPLADVICLRCKKGDDEGHLLMCEGCDSALHTYCSIPQLKEVPKGEWRCTSCSYNEASSLPVNFGFVDSNVGYTLDTFATFANDFKKDYFKIDPKKVPSDLVERTFWKGVADKCPTSLAVKYGADLITSKVGSGFERKTDAHIKDKIIANHPWNLNNMPVLRDSVLTHFDNGISGMMVPWVYVGMCFSTFCWHTEDHWTYSVNYNHWGERKVWYGISGNDAEKFEQVVKEICPSLFADQRDLLHHMTTAVNPYLLRSKGINVTTVHQDEGEFVITFPRAYHAGFNEGLNFAEAVNFAPIDWVRMGRQCMVDYALVRRFCVFSHDELVLKMVNASDKISISMAVTALDELNEISQREIRQRKAANSSGVRTCRLVQFESIADDHRACRVCNTTLFMSAIRCAHNRLTCLDHIASVCKKCPPEERVLEMRYRLEELHSMKEKLRLLTKAYDEWEEAVEGVVESGRKPDLSKVQRLLDQAQSRHFPSSALLDQLHAMMDTCSPLLARATAMAGERVRVRNKTRIQRADTRPDLEQVKDMRKELEKLPIECTELVNQMDDVIGRAETWEKEARKMVETSEEEAIGDIEIDTLLQKAEELNLRLPLLPQLEKTRQRQQWASEKADPFDSWRPTAEMEAADDFMNRLRWTLAELDELIAEGERLEAEGSQRLASLRAKRAAAADANEEARKLFARAPTVDTVRDLWSTARECDWCSAASLNELRQEMDYINQVNMYTTCSDLTWTDLMRAIDLCRSSRVLPQSAVCHAFTADIENMTKVTKRLRCLLVPSCSYYSLYEIIHYREDLIPLAEGQLVPIHLDTSTLAESWIAMDNFECRDELIEHLKKMVSQQESFYERLRRTNDANSAKSSCHCLSEKPGAVLKCLLCHSKTHHGCAWWDSSLALLPPGCFLCVRCVRGRRPNVDHVTDALTDAPAKSLEVMLVSFVIEEVSRQGAEILELVEQWKKSSTVKISTKLRQAILNLLAHEMVDPRVQGVVAEPMTALFKEYLDGQRDMWESVKKQPIPGKLPESLFVEPRRSRPQSGSAPSKRKARATVTEEESSICAHPRCIRPYTENTVTWVQCEQCRLWLHIICTSEIITKDTADYFCESCRDLQRKRRK